MPLLVVDDWDVGPTRDANRAKVRESLKNQCCTLPREDKVVVKNCFACRRWMVGILGLKEARVPTKDGHQLCGVAFGIRLVNFAVVL